MTGKTELTADDYRLVWSFYRSDLVGVPLRPPHNVDPVPLDKTEAGWSVYPWNPPDFSLLEGSEYPIPEGPDPDAPPKPTWAEICRLRDEAIILDVGILLSREPFGSRIPPLTAELDRASAALANRPVGVDGIMPDGIHIGDRIPHLAGVAHLDRRRGNPGWQSVPITLRRADAGGLVHLWTGAEVQDFIDQNVIATNRIEGARNIVHVEAHDAAAVLRGDRLPLDDAGGEITDPDLVFAAQVELAERFRAVLDDARPALLEALAMADNPPLPDDPDRIRSILLERVESYATQRVQFFKGMIGEQGMDISEATCPEQANSISEVHRVFSLAERELCRTEDRKEMESISDRAIADIQAVQVQGIPLWRSVEDGTALNLTDGVLAISRAFTPALTRSFTIRFRAVNPPGASNGLIGIEVPLSSRSEDWIVETMVEDVAESGDPMSHTVEIRPAHPTGTVPAESRFEFTARNGCGPSRIVVVIENTEA